MTTSLRLVTRTSAAIELVARHHHYFICHRHNAKILVNNLTGTTFARQYHCRRHDVDGTNFRLTEVSSTISTSSSSSSSTSSLSTTSSSFEVIGDRRREHMNTNQSTKNNNFLKKIEVSPNGRIVYIHFVGNDRTSTAVSTMTPYHASWLWSNDPQRVVHPTSGQRMLTPGDYRYTDRPTIASARIIYCYNNKNDGYVHKAEENGNSMEELQFPTPTMSDSCHPLATYYGKDRSTACWIRSKASSSMHGNDESAVVGCYLIVEWKSNTKRRILSTYDMEWLYRFRYDKQSRKEHRRNSEVTPLHAIHKSGPPLWYSTTTTTTATATATATSVDSHTTSSSSSSSSSSQPSMSHNKVDGLVHIEFDSIDQEDGKFRLLHHVFRDGAALVINTPLPGRKKKCNDDDNNNIDCVDRGNDQTDDYPVARVAKAMSGGHLSHGSLYGDIFHVRDNPHSNNVAYTSLELCPHQDLAYYESPPGMQLLHCVANGSGVVGGESLLIDAMAAAYRLREIRPQSFDVLTKCPATFVKQRDGACMTYRTPHIVLSAEEDDRSSSSSSLGGNSTNRFEREIVAVWWSPPFEGPILLPPEQVDEYYDAYADFEQILNSSVKKSHFNIDDDDDNVDDELSRYAKAYTWERKLKPGEILVFNNRRMLHGRRGFSVTDGAKVEDTQRHLVGCYTNIDDTLNMYRLLLRESMGYETTPSIVNVGNGTTILP